MSMSRHIRVPAIVALVAFITANCSTQVHPKLSADDIEHNQALKTEDFIEYAVLLTGDTITFDESGGSYAAYRLVVHGTTTDGKRVEIPLSEIEYVGVEREDHDMALVLVIGIPVATVAFTYLLLSLGAN